MTIQARPRKYRRTRFAPLLLLLVSLGACASDSEQDSTGSSFGDSSPQHESGVGGSGSTSSGNNASSSGPGTGTNAGSEADTTGDSSDPDQGSGESAGSGGNACEVVAGDDACRACTKQNCCELTQRCANDPVCHCGAACQDRGDDVETCMEECQGWSLKHELFLELGVCGLRSCPAECAHTATSSGDVSTDGETTSETDTTSEGDGDSTATGDAGSETAGSTEG